MGRTELVFTGVLALAFVPALLSLAGAWGAAEYQSHGFLVLAVAAWIAFETRHARRRLPRERDLRGAALVAGSLAVYAFGLLAGSVSLQGVALVGAVAGGVWFLRGTRWLRALAFPIGYLIFMVPIPPDWLTPVTVQLLLFVTTTSVAVLHGLGIAVVRDGNVLTLPGGQSLFVAEACSGLTSLVTLIPIGVLIAYVTRLPLARQVLLVALVVPIALVANLVRVLATALGAHAFGAAAVTDEPQHTLLGLSVYAIGCLALIAAARLLRPGPPAPPARAGHQPSPS